jgi:phosphate transport system protein
MPTQHSSKQYDNDLEEIRSKVLLMAGMVENQLQEAMNSLKTSNVELALQVMKGDEGVNGLEVALDDACSHLIVKRQPAANDLRTVMATIKVITDLERIGDEAAKIARSVTTTNARNVTAINQYETVRMLAERAASLLHGALDSFARLDIEQAQKIIVEDEVIDHEFRSVMRSLITFMMEDPRTISTALDTMWMAKSIERIGDHAKNIAEYVIFIVEGKDIRHAGHITSVS